MGCAAGTAETETEHMSTAMVTTDMLMSAQAAAALLGLVLSLGLLPEGGLLRLRNP